MQKSLMCALLSLVLMSAPSRHRINFECAVFLCCCPVECVQPFTGEIINVPCPPEDILPLILDDELDKPTPPPEPARGHDIGADDDRDDS